MAQTDYQSELLEIWRNKRFSDSIAAKAYEGTNNSGPVQDSSKPLTESKTFLACVVEHSKCNVQVVTDNYVHRCFCPCHTETDAKINLIDMNLKEIRLWFRTEASVGVGNGMLYCNAVDV